MAKVEKKDSKPFGDIKEGGFREWLGKSEDAEITDADIEKGLRSRDPHVRKMAQFAKNAKKFKHPKKKGTKVAAEEIAPGAPAWLKW